jgi:hypothetical protein
MRLFANLAIVIVALQLSVQSEQKANPQSQNGNTQNAPNQTAPVTVVVNQPTPQPKEDSPKDKSRDFYDAAVLVLAVGGFCIALRSLYYVSKQAKSTEEAAKAGTKSADALVAGQRAWVMVDIEFKPTGVVTEVRGTDRFHCVHIRMNYRNDGQTPAWITERRACLVVITDNVIPQLPDLSKAKPIAYGTIPLAAGRRHGYGHFDMPLECPAEYSPDVIRLIYGVVRYRTAFSGTGETIFGYRVTRGWDRLERLDELTEWNKNT